MNEVFEGVMDDQALILMERMTRDLIKTNLRMEKVEGKRGTIYLAHGLDADGDVTGIWGYRGFSKVWNYKPETSLDSVRQHLMDHATEIIEDMVDRDLLDA